MISAQSVIDLVSTVLDEDRVRFDTIEETQVIRTAYRGQHARYRVLIRVTDEPLMLTVVVPLPLTVPESRRPELAEAVNRANFGMVLGRFELGMHSGDLYFHAAAPLCDAGLSAEQLHTVLGLALSLSDRYYRAFARLLFVDDLSPAEAIAEVEMTADA